MRDIKKTVLNQPLDVGLDFKEYDSTYFNLTELVEFNGTDGKIKWDRYNRKYRMSFNCMTAPFEKSTPWEFPAEYEVDEIGDFRIDFVNQRTLRIRLDVNHNKICDENDLMFAGDIPNCRDYVRTENDEYIIFSGDLYDVYIYKKPMNIEIKDKKGETIVRTYNISDNKSLDNTYPIPFSYIRSEEDLKRKIAASFYLKYDEKIYGCGESFTRLNKRGQRVNLYTYDALGVQNKDMYKPIPFFMSNKGYGMFVHSSCAMTYDFGHDYDETTTLYLDDDRLDLFIFLGGPKDILNEYTAITGRAQMPPDWSFGLWMGRITYFSEEQVRTVATRMRDEKIPCDVIHLDTGWFEDDWKCNYKFAPSRFDDAEKMIKDLAEMGFKISLWQLPYITPTNELYKEALENKYYVTDSDGKVPTEDLIIDFSNEKAVKWYQSLLKGLFDIGVKAIKVDFGEGAPYLGRYASGKSGRYEHNLYPLRYNKAVNDITKECNNENIIWARSTWAGSQRYPLHWGGDAEITNSAMAASLRGGLSLGLCGFTFWSHDIGGFTQKSPEELYSRWTPFGMLTSHSRCHGQPPKEPWDYSDKFKDIFRRSVELKYKLFKYIKDESIEATQKGYPLLRTLFFEYPQDRIAWDIEDEYFFGSKLLVAPLFEDNATGRDVYLPEGEWVDFFTKEAYSGGRYLRVNSTELPIILLVKKGESIPLVEVAECMDRINLDKVNNVQY
jgi:alpha-glucosidase